MQFLQKFTRIILFISLSVWLTACGGGGGGDSDSDSHVEDTLSCHSDSGVRSVAPAADSTGDVYVGGFFQYFNGVSTNYIVRLNSDGSRDNAFEIGSGFDDLVWSIVPAADGTGDIYVGGRFRSYNGVSANYIARLNSDGSLDTGFVTGSIFHGPVEAITLAADGTGDIYASGVVRLHSDGSLDNFFNASPSSPSGYSIARAPLFTGDTYVGGNPSIKRLNSDGSLDIGFVTSGEVGSNNAIVRSIALLADGTGDIYVGGFINAEPYKGLFVRLNSDGSQDVAFDPGSGFDGVVESIEPLWDGTGDIYVGGRFRSYDGVSANYFIRLNNDGSRENNFLSGGFAGQSEQVMSIARATDGTDDVYVAGSFGSYRGTEQKGAARLNSDGSLDTGFAIGEGFCG